MPNDTFSIIAKRFFIATTANELCKKTSLDEIAVDEICETAGVSRSGFYRAFHSKYDIAPWCLRFPLEEGVGKMGRSLTCQEGIAITLEIFALFKDLFNAAKKTSEMLVCDEEERRHVVALIRETLETRHGTSVDEALAFQIEWVTAAGLDVSEDWIRGTIDKSPAELAELFASCYPPRLRKLLDDPVDHADDGDFDLSRFVVSMSRHAPEETQA